MVISYYSSKRKLILAPFHRLLDHLGTLFCEVPVQVFWPFKITELSFSYWYIGIICIFWVWILCQIYIANIFFHLVACIFYSEQCLLIIRSSSFNEVQFNNLSQSYTLWLMLSVSCLYKFESWFYIVVYNKVSLTISLIVGHIVCFLYFPFHKWCSDEHFIKILVQIWNFF